MDFLRQSEKSDVLAFLQLCEKSAVSKTTHDVNNGPAMVFRALHQVIKVMVRDIVPGPAKMQKK